jgi:hypothetical protein
MVLNANLDLKEAEQALQQDGLDPNDHLKWYIAAVVYNIHPAILQVWAVWHSNDRGTSA